MCLWYDECLPLNFQMVRPEPPAIIVDNVDTYDLYDTMGFTVRTEDYR